MSSQMLYLWDATDHGTPGNMFEVLKIFNQLVEKPERPGRAILAFAQRIQDLARFHQVFDEEAGKLYKNLVEQVKQHENALHVLELPGSNDVSLLSILVETAKLFNLVIYDDQRVLAFLPTGAVLPESKTDVGLDAPAPAEKDESFPKTLAEFEAYVDPIIEVMMARHGFKKGHISGWNKPDYIRNVSYGVQVFSVGYQQTKYGNFMIAASLNIRMDLIEQIHDNFKFHKRSTPETFDIQFLNDLLERKDTPGKSFEFRDRDKRVVLEFLDIMERTIFPLFDAAQDVKGLDNLVNGNVSERFKWIIQGRGIYSPRCLILARLANNPLFDELAVTLATPRSPMINKKALVTEWPKLVEYLREEVKPLV